MNKKILSIFALIMAISILGVSCADNNTTNPTPTTPPIGETEANAVLNTGLGNNLQVVAKGSSAPTIVFDLSQVEVTASGANYTASVKSTTALTAAGSTLRIDDLVAAVEAKKGGMQTAGSITIDTIVGKKTGDKTATVTINYTAKNGKAAIVITFTLPDDSASNTIAYDENHYISITAIQDAFDGLGIVNSVGTGDDTSDNVTFDSTSITLGGFKLTAVQGSSDSSGNNTDLALIDQVVEKINSSFTLAGGTATAEGPNSDPSGQTEADIKVTITLDTGYKFDTDVTTADVNDGVVTVKIAPTTSKDWGTRG